MSSAPVRRYSRQEYFAIERQAQERHEYWRGQIYAIAGGSPRHSLIALNIGAALKRQLRGTPCQPYGSDLRIGIPAKDGYVYPNVSIICGKLELEEHAPELVLNPAAIFEVLSETTERHDRGDKFAAYRTIPSFREYVLVSQQEPRVDRFILHHDGHWEFADTVGLEARFELNSVPGCRLTLAEVYDGVEFDGKDGKEEIALSTR